MNIAIFLIGSNPLPNYVVLKYLLLENRENKNELPVPDKIAFLHSSDTKEYAVKIKNKLGINGITELINLGSEHRKSETIINEIRHCLNSLNKELIESIHLNYTGGTKSMAVHAYQAIKEFKNISKIIFSDIDPDNYKLLTNLDNPWHPSNGDLRDVITVSIEEILDLHDIKIKGQLTDNLEINNLDISKFSQIALDNIKDAPKDDWRSSLQKIKSDKKEIDKINQVFNPVINFDDYINNYLELARFIEFSEGKWLEDYVLYILKELRKELKITDLSKSVEVYSNDRRAEIDLIAMKGYQMHIISCTTSQKIKPVKGKAFEVLYRAEQLGGDHAQVILVTLMKEKPKDKNDEHNLKKLSDDLLSFDAKYNKKIKLIGIEDLKDDIKIRNIFRNILTN